MKNKILLSTLLFAGCASSQTTAVEGVETVTETAGASVNITNLIEGYAKYNMKEMSTDLWAEDVELISVDSPMGTHIKGRDAVAEFVGPKFRSVYPDVKLGPARVFALDANTVFVEAVMRGTNTGPMPNGAPASNKEMGLTVGHLYTFNADGKIQKLETFVNEMAIMVQLGVMPPPMGKIPPLAGLPTEPEIVTTAGNAANLEMTKKVDAASFTTHDASVLDQYLAENIQVGFPAREDLSGRETVKEGNKPFWAAFTDGSIAYKNAWTVGDYTITVVEHTATHTGKLGPFEATNKKFTRTFVSVTKWEAGKITSTTGYGNPLGALKQIGLFPPKKPEAKEVTAN